MAENVTVVRGSNRYQRQKKLCEGNVFTSVCQSFGGWVGMRCPRSLREWVCPGGLDMENADELARKLTSVKAHV